MPGGALATFTWPRGLTSELDLLPLTGATATRAGILTALDTHVPGASGASIACAAPSARACRDSATFAAVEVVPWGNPMTVQTLVE